MENLLSLSQPAANAIIESKDPVSLIAPIACSLSSPLIAARRAVLDILLFLSYYKESCALEHVLASLDALSAANSMQGRYDYWFKALDETLNGRGLLGSLVGASEELKRNQGIDSNLNDYAVRGSLSYQVLQSLTPPYSKAILSSSLVF